MKYSTRLRAWVLALVALSLTTYGVVIAATDKLPGASAHDPLALQGYPPSTAKITISLQTSSGFSATADVGVDFANDVLSGTATTSALPTGLTFYWSGSRLNATVTGTGAWFALHTPIPSLYGYSLEVTKPDIALISGFSSETIRRAGSQTTYVFTSQHSSLQMPFGAPGIKDGTVTWSITTGSQGEITGTTLVAVSGGVTTTLHLVVDAYNVKIHPDVPAGNVTVVAPSQVLNILSSLSGSGISLPSGLWRFL